MIEQEWNEYKYFRQSILTSVRNIEGIIQEVKHDAQKENQNNQINQPGKEPIMKWRSFKLKINIECGIDLQKRHAVKVIEILL